MTFKRYDAIIKVIPCHSSYLWISQCLPCRLERLRSGTALTPSHHYLSMEHTWSFFIIFANKNIAQTSPQEGTLESLNVYVPHQRHLKIMPFFHGLPLKLWVEFWVGMKVGHTCITYIALSKINHKEIQVIHWLRRASVWKYDGYIWCLS